MNENSDPVVVSTTEARQANPRKMNLRVLIVSLVLAVIAAAVIYTVFYSQPAASAVL